MASRKFPVSSHGKIGELDSHIKRGSRTGTFVVKSSGEQMPNLTAARMAVVEKLGLHDKYTEDSLTTIRQWPDQVGGKTAGKRSAKKAATKSSTTKTAVKTHRTKVEAPEMAAPSQTIHKPRTPRHSPHPISAPMALDPFDSTNRIFMRIPFGTNGMLTELSIPKNIDEKDLATALKVLKNLKS